MKQPFNLTVFLIFIASFAFGQDSSKIYLFVGSYTSGESSEGIAVYKLNTQTGELTEVERASNLVNPSFLTIAPNRQFLYACTNTRLKKHGSISAFKIDTLTGKLTFLNQQSTGGRNPVHVIVNKTNRYVIASNYTDAGISIFECNADGSLQSFSKLIEFEGSSIIKGRQNAAHIHSCNFSFDNKYIFAPDLGSDKIRVLKFDKGLLTVIDSLTIKTKSGAGPRHFTFHPNQSYAYSIEELSGTISFYSYKNGQLKLSQTYRSYENESDEYASSDIHISPDGKYLYASNRQDENSISIFKINPKNGELSLIGHQSTYGAIPRSFVISPTGKHLIVANQKTNEIVVFDRNATSGLLTKVTVTVGLDAPASLKMVKYH
ncbi:MAG: lactonase family protein [Saprospiraceae bacterium]